MDLFNKLLFKILWQLKKYFEKHAIKNLKSIYNIHDSVEIFYPIIFNGNISIGENTYIMHYCEFITGENSKITIGSNCAIAKNVTIRSLTHEQNKPLYRTKNLKEKDVFIGDNCWIGANVFIKEGVTIGSNSIIGANSVVTKSFPENSIIGGAPAISLMKNV
ncbi:MAG: acyltransferase [Flavobacteriales bacterium]|nr:acyltransferase [Flavobacteriales bacterium]